MTALPWYQHHADRARVGRSAGSSRERTPWGRITRVHPFPTDKRNIPARALAFGGFTALAGRVGAATRTGRTSCWPCRRRSRSAPPAGRRPARRVPFVFNIQDVFPDVAVELGPSPTPRDHRAAPLARALHLPPRRRGDRAVRRPARQRRRQAAPADAVDDRRSRVRVIPNFVDTERIRSVAAGERVPRRVRPHRQARRDVRGQRRFLPVARPRARRGRRPGRRARRRVRDQRRRFGPARSRAAGPGPGERALRGHAAQGPPPEVLAAGRRPRGPAAAGPGPVQRAVASSTRSWPPAGRRGQRRSGHRGRPHRRAGRRRPRRAPEDPEAFTKAVRRLLDDAGDRRRHGGVGRRFVEGWASPPRSPRRTSSSFEARAAFRRPS